MVTKKIQLIVSAIDKVKTFVNINSKYDCTIDVVSGRYVIDGKSIMGMFSLDLTKVLDVTIECENESDIDSLIKEYEAAKLTV